MKKFLTLLCAVVLVLGTIGTADALTISAVDGNWTGTIGGGSNVNLVNNVVVSYGNGFEDQIRWGDPPAGGEQSGLGFTGTLAPATFDIDDTFAIGQLRHFNNPTYTATAASAAFLAIGINFSDPTGLNGTFDFNFAIDETLNSTGDNWIDRDFITFPSSYSPETFDIEGVNYTLQLLGFGNSANTLVDSFASPENGTNATQLWGRITTSEPVPEPSTLLLMGIGLLGLVGYNRKRSKKS